MPLRRSAAPSTLSIFTVLLGAACLGGLPACADMLGFDQVDFSSTQVDASLDDASADSSPLADGSAGDVTAPIVDGAGLDVQSEAAGESCGDDVCSPEESCETCPSDCGECPVECGDGVCSPEESCETCPGDCGECPVECGDGSCDTIEDCASCPQDCGECPPSCGDGACNGTESCSNCKTDCGECPPSCGDGSCNGSETCSNCNADCGDCPPACGDGSCNGNETCSSCPADCKVTTCPTAPSGFSVGSGLSAINVCSFPMRDANTWAARDAIITKLAAILPVRSVSYVLGDLNRQGTAVSSVPGLSSVNRAFKWAQGDEDVTYWIPQGITGSGDSVAGKISGKNVVLTSWYYSGAAPNKGVRVAFADAASKTYRFALLVEPYTNAGRPDFKAVAIHAGGLAWWGNLLYVADTTHGFRVFDTSRILQVTTGVDAIGYDSSAGVYRAHNYKYVIAQIGNYQHASSCSPRFSFTALDRGSSPPSIVSGEYIDGDPKGRLLRWSVDPATGRLAGGSIFVPKQAFFSGQTNIQGAVPSGSRWFLSSSAPAAGHGALYRVSVGASKTFAWSDSPEDLYIDPSTGELWCLSEATGARYVYSRLLSNY